MRAFVIDVAIEPRRAEQSARLHAALETLQRDGSIAFRFDEESGQTIVSGTDELSLDGAIGQLRAVAGEISVGAPQVAYRETITRKVELDHTHKRPTEFARIRFRVEPGGNGAGFRSRSTVAGGNIPEDYAGAVLKGVESVLRAGPVIGFPMTDLVFTLLDGAWHETDSSADAFEIAGRIGFREAVEKALPRILEPIMRVDVLAPADYAGDVIGDLNSRRGQIRGAEEVGGAVRVHAKVPMSNLFGYVNSLRALSKGQARYSMVFDLYEQVPDHPLGPDDRFPHAAAIRA